MFCSNCGIKIDDNAKFCYNCGAENLKANRIGNIEEANKNLEVFVICNENVRIEKGLITYGRLEKKALQKAGEILDQSREDYLNKVDKIKTWQDKCDLLITIGNHACNQMKEYCAGFLIELGIYTYPKYEFINAIPQTNCCGKYISKIENTIEAGNKAIDDDMNQKMKMRSYRKENRGRFVGGGFGIGGAIAGAFKAGIMNMMTGAAYTVANTVANAATLASGIYKKSQLLNADVQARDFFRYLYDDLENISTGALGILVNNIKEAEITSVSKESKKEAEAIISNLKSGNIPDKLVGKYIVKGINTNPNELDFYVLLLLKFPQENENAKKILNALNIEFEKVVEHYLNNYSNAIYGNEKKEFYSWLCAEKDDEREITIEDVQTHRRRVEQNEEIVRHAMSEFGVHEQELQEGFVKQYATRAARLKRIDEEYRKIKIVEVDEENRICFGPEYVLAETYDEMIEYLKARQTLFELLDQFDIKTASYFDSIDDLDAISKEDAFQMILDIIPKLICDIEELVAQIEEIDKKQLFTTVLIAALNNIIAKMKEVPQLLQEEKEKYEIELQRQKELSKRNIETFRKCVDSRGMRQSKFFHIFDKEINPELMRKIQQDFECRNDERLLMMCCCETGFKTEFVMTNENLHISDKYRTKCWKLESIDVVSIIKSERTISLYLEGKEHQQDSFGIEENQLEDINMFVYQFNYFLREINGNEISENRLDCIDKEMPLMDSTFRDLVKTSKHCIVGQPYITAINMDNFMIAKKCIGIPDTVKTYMIYDTTTFGSWNNGIAFCEDGIYYNIDSDQGKMSWDYFSRARIKKGLAFVSIYIGNLRIQTDCTEDSKILIQTVEKWQKIILSYPRQFGIKIELENQDSCIIAKNNAQNQASILEVSNDTMHKPDLVETKVNDEMFCTHCGKKIKRTTKFCNYCGNKVAYH